MSRLSETLIQPALSGGINYVLAKASGKVSGSIRVFGLMMPYDLAQSLLTALISYFAESIKNYLIPMLPIPNTGIVGSIADPSITASMSYVIYRLMGRKENMVQASLPFVSDLLGHYVYDHFVAVQQQ